MPNLLKSAAPSGIVAQIGSSSQHATQQGARNGTDLAAWAKQNGVYPLLVIGGLVLLVVLFVFLAKMKRDS